MKQFRYDLNAMASAITPKTKLIFIANPDNPVGTYVSHAELGRFLGRVPDSCVVFIDEAYYEFACARRDYPKSFSFLKRPNVIVSRTFSKAYGLSGLRIGYGFTSPEIAKALNKVREPFNINLLAQAGAAAALQDGRFLKKVIAATEREKVFLQKEFTRLAVGTLPSATNFILASFGEKAEAVYEGLLKRGIIVRSMKSWGLRDYIRVTIGTPKENRLFVKNLEIVLKTIHRRRMH